MRGPDVRRAERQSESAQDMASSSYKKWHVCEGRPCRSGYTQWRWLLTMGRRPVTESCTWSCVRQRPMSRGEHARSQPPAASRPLPPAAASRQPPRRYGGEADDPAA
jgi:hypothetical protein